MRRTLNPFSPGSGLTPPFLVGRQSEIDDFDVIIERTAAGMTSRGVVLHGLRGVGKTVLLGQFRQRADEAGWFTIELEGRSPGVADSAARHKLGRDLLVASRRLTRRSHASGAIAEALRTVKSVSLTLGIASIDIGVDAADGRGDSGRLDVDFEEMVEDLAPALREAGLAFAIFVDEMQDLDSELLTALLSSQHRAGQRGWPFFVFGAGLPSLPSILSEARSYAERLFSYRRIGALQPDAARDALIVPAAREGLAFATGSAELIADASGGYPYFLQTYGQAAWEIARDRELTLDEARQAVAEGNADLDMGFFPARWDRATHAERAYLTAMAIDGDGGSHTSELARRLQTKLAALSTARQGLIEKGIIYVPERGTVAFTVPNMAAFVSRQHSAIGE